MELSKFNNLKLIMFIAAIIIVFFVLDAIALSSLHISAGTYDFASANTNHNSMLTVNNTFWFPAFASMVEYKLTYAGNVIVDARTGSIAIAPKSASQVPANISINYTAAGLSGLQALQNLFSKNQQKLQQQKYAYLGPVRFSAKS
jgi:hypothetical protein